MAMIHNILFVLPAGGSSIRFGSNKLFALLHGLPVFLHAAFAASKIIPQDSIVLSVPQNQENVFRELNMKYLPDLHLNFVHGGESRMKSVLNALEAYYNNHKYKYVAVHDAGRPLLTEALIQKTYMAAQKTGGAILCRKVTETVKQIDEDGIITNTLNRDSLRIAETPQIFLLEELLKATRLAIQNNESFTDDAQVIQKFSDIKISPVEHTECNLKITYKEDLQFCEKYLQG